MVTKAHRTTSAQFTQKTPRVVKTLQTRLSGGDIVVSRQADPEEPFVVAEIQVCLATVIKHKHFAVLER